jgi:hypothetical protein
MRKIKGMINSKSKSSDLGMGQFWSIPEKSDQQQIFFKKKDLGSNKLLQQKYSGNQLNWKQKKMI